MWFLQHGLLIAAWCKEKMITNKEETHAVTLIKTSAGVETYWNEWGLCGGCIWWNITGRPRGQSSDSCYFESWGGISGGMTLAPRRRRLYGRSWQTVCRVKSSLMTKTSRRRPRGCTLSCLISDRDSFPCCCWPSRSLIKPARNGAFLWE